MASGGGYSYGDVSSREDLSDTIKDLDVLDTWVTSHSSTVDVTNKVHSWVLDPIAAVTTQAGTAEGGDTTYAAVNPTQATNTTQIIEYGVLTTKTNQNTDHAGFTDKFAREKLKKMKEWKNQLELSVVAGALVSGTGTAARTMKGIAKFATTNTSGFSSVSLTSDILNLIMGVGWDNGAEFDTILVGKVLKQRISSFTVGNTRNVAAEDAIIVGRVDTYDSDFGRVTVVKHRYVNTATSQTQNGMVCYMQDYVRVGVMDSVHYEDRPAPGYFKVGAVVGEYTVEACNEKAIAYHFGLL
jgi:hypothetical protein